MAYPNPALNVSRYNRDWASNFFFALCPVLMLGSMAFPLCMTGFSYTLLRMLIGLTLSSTTSICKIIYLVTLTGCFKLEFYIYEHYNIKI